MAMHKKPSHSGEFQTRKGGPVLSTKSGGKLVKPAAKKKSPKKKK